MNTSSVWAVVSAFRPRTSLLEAYDALTRQVQNVIVVDDGSGSAFDEIFDALTARSAQVIRLSENSGIGAALNAGYESALEQGADAVVSFDQDSHIGPGFIDGLRTAFEDAESRGIATFAAVPEYFAGLRQVFREREDGTLEARNIIQSGMYTSAAALRRLGLMREDFFIDLIDTEFDLRARSVGLVAVAARGVSLDHQWGTQYERRLFGRPFSLPGLPPVVTLSTPFRYFYRVRNRFVLNRLYGWLSPQQLRHDTVGDILHFINAVTMARPRTALLRIMIAGWRQSRRGIMGRMPKAAQELAARISWASSPVEADPLGNAREPSS